MTIKHSSYKNRNKNNAIVAVRTRDYRELRQLLDRDLVDVNMVFDPELYYNKGSDKEVPTNVTWTLLHESTYRGLVSIVGLLLEYGADVNVLVDTKDLRCTKWDNGGSWDVMSYEDNEYYDMNGETALDIAEKFELEKIVSLLTDAGAKFSEQMIHEHTSGNSNAKPGKLVSPPVPSPSKSSSVRTYSDVVMGK